MKKSFFLFIMVSILFVSSAIADNWSVLQPGWWDASTEVVEDAARQLNDEIARRKGQQPVYAAPTATPGRIVVPTASPVPVQQAPQQSNELSQNYVRPEFKALIDDLDAWFTKFYEISSTKDSPDQSTMLRNYSDLFTMMAELSDKIDQFNAIDRDDLTIAEVALYLQLASKIMDAKTSL